MSVPSVPETASPVRSVDAIGGIPCTPSGDSRYRALIEASHGVVWRAAPDLACLETWGWDIATGQTQAQSMGEGWLDVVHPEDRDRIVTVLDEARRAGQPYERDVPRAPSRRQLSLGTL